MPENTNSMLSTLRKLRQMKDPEGYIRSLKTEKELLLEWSSALDEQLWQLRDEGARLLEELENEKSSAKVMEASYVLAILILSYFTSLHFFS